jgi:hypothetical protein
MTVVAAWTRDLPGVKELVICSDSRLRAGYAWDACPKIFPLARSDSVIAFAGDTNWAYPLLLQLDSAIALFPRSRDRASDIEEMKTYALKVLNDMLGEFRYAAPGLSIPDVEFVLGGWSWIRAEFRLWLFRYSPRLRRFFATLAGSFNGANVLFAGSGSSRAYTLFRHMLAQEGRLSSKSLSLDLEPFRVVTEMLRSAGPADDVGGPPQIVKVYQHMNSRSLGVWWPHKTSGRIAYGGRLLREYEYGDVFSILDPDTLRTESPPRFSREEDALIHRVRLLKVLAARARALELR